MDFLKAEQLGKYKWRVLSIPFGGPLSGKDTDDEFFSRRTDIKPDWFDRRPAIWHHNMDRTMKADSTIGTSDDLELDENLGWWSTVWLERSHQYWAAIDELLRSGKVYGSSGTMPHFVKKDQKTGEILAWPFVEQTFTPTPANFFSQVRPAKAISHFDAAGIDLSPAVRGLFLDPNEDLSPDLPSGGDETARLRAHLTAKANAEAALLKAATSI